MIDQELYDQCEKMLIGLDSLIENGHERADLLKLARHHIQAACAYLAHDRMDDAGAHLTTARAYLKYVKGAA